MTELFLDHPRLATTIRTSTTASPRWEMVAYTTSGNLVDFDGDSGTVLLATLNELLDEPARIGHVELTVWVPQ